MTDFLDTSGLTYFWSKLKSTLVPIQNTITNAEIDEMLAPITATIDRRMRLTDDSSYLWGSTDRDFIYGKLPQLAYNSRCISVAYDVTDISIDDYESNIANRNPDYYIYTMDIDASNSLYSLKFVPYSSLPSGTIISNSAGNVDTFPSYFLCLNQFENLIYTSQQIIYPYQGDGANYILVNGAQNWDWLKLDELSINFSDFLDIHGLSVIESIQPITVEY